MRILKSIFLVLVASTILTSCSDDAIPVFSGDVSVTLINKTSTEVIEGEAATFTYDVVLSNTFKEDITINFNLDELTNYPNLLSIEPVTIVKDQTKGILKVTATKKPDAENVLANDLKLTFAIKDYQGVTNKLYLADNYIVTVKAEEGITPLTADQQALIKHYKSQGIDLSMWIGKIPVQVKVVTAPNGSFAPFETSQTLNYTGITHITLSENATKDKPLLVMTKNAFGLSEYLQYVFRHETVLNTEYWNEPSQASIQEILKALGTDRVTKWEKKEYAFNVTLDNLEFKSGGTIDFVRENGTYDDYTNYLEPLKPEGKNFNAVDFRYEFELWNEFVTLAKNNSDLVNHMQQGGSIHPGNYIPETNILEDEWGESNWVAPTSSYNATEMNFKFNTDHTYSGDYDIVTVKFTQPN